MLITLAGMVMAVRLLQKEKASFPMLVTPAGMLMEVRLLQLEKAYLQPVITQYFASNKSEIWS